MSVELNKRDMVSVQRDLAYLGQERHGSMYTKARWECRGIKQACKALW